MDESVKVLTGDVPPDSGQVNPAVNPPGTETLLAEVLAELLGHDRVSVQSNFFDDLGANSLVMAQFCARVRKRQPDLPPVSMKSIYHYPTIQSLAAALASTSTPPGPSETTTSPRGDQAVPATRRPSAQESVDSAMPASTRQYVACGTLQLLIFLAYSYLAEVVAISGYRWISADPGPVDIYLRSVIFGGVAFVGMCGLPVAAKWMLIGRWKPSEFPIWSLAYVRFWTVKALLHANPMILFVGNPLYVFYLRALGARIGKGVTVLSSAVPVCTDLLSIGAGSVIRKDSFFLCYRAYRGHIQTGFGHARARRVHRREDRARHQYVDGRRSAARSHVGAAERRGCTGGPAVARFARTAHRPRLLTGSPDKLQYAPPGKLRGPDIAAGVPRLRTLGDRRPLRAADQAAPLGSRLGSEVITSRASLS